MTTKAVSAAYERAESHTCKRKHCPYPIPQQQKGRPALYCSETCRQADYRERRNEKQRQVDTDRRMEMVTAAVEHALALELPTNSRVSATKRRATAEAVTRHLRLAYLIS